MCSNTAEQRCSSKPTVFTTPDEMAAFKSLQRNEKLALELAQSFKRKKEKKGPYIHTINTKQINKTFRAFQGGYMT